MHCDAHYTERATTIIELEQGQLLTFCNHHARKVIDSLVDQGKRFNVTRDRSFTTYLGAKHGE